MSQRLNLIAQATTNSAGKCTFTFPAVPQGLVWTGMLSVPMATASAAMTVYAGSAGTGSSPLFTFTGTSAGGPVMVGSLESITVAATNLAPSTGYTCTYIGGSDQYGPDTQWIGPTGSSPSPSITAGQGVFRVIEQAGAVLLQFFVSPDTAYGLLPEISTTMGTGVVDTVLDGGSPSPNGHSFVRFSNTATVSDVFVEADSSLGGRAALVLANHGDSAATLQALDTGGIEAAQLTLTANAVESVATIHADKFGWETFVARPVITGSRSGATVSVLQQLLAALSVLSGLGFITDSTAP